MRLNTIITNCNKWSEDAELSQDYDQTQLMGITEKIFDEEILETIDAWELLQGKKASGDFAPSTQLEILDELADGFADVFFVGVNGQYKYNRINGVDPIESTNVTLTRVHEQIINTGPVSLSEAIVLLRTRINILGACYWGLKALLEEFGKGDAPEAVLQQVLTANDAKRNPDGSFTYNDWGKVVKPAGWTAPDHKGFFDVQS